MALQHRLERLAEVQRALEVFPAGKLRYLGLVRCLHPGHEAPKAPNPREPTPDERHSDVGLIIVGVGFL